MQYRVGQGIHLNVETINRVQSKFSDFLARAFGSLPTSHSIHPSLCLAMISLTKMPIPPLDLNDSQTRAIRSVKIPGVASGQPHRVF